MLVVKLSRALSVVVSTHQQHVTYVARIRLQVSCEDEMVDKHEVQEAWSFDEPDERDFYRPRHESSSSSSRADLLRRIAARVEEDRDEDSCTRLTDTTDVEMDRVERVEPQLEAPPPSPQAAPTAPRNIAPTSSPMDGKWNWLFANKFGS